MQEIQRKCRNRRTTDRQLLHPPYRPVRVVPEGYMAYNRVDDEVAIVLKFVVARLLREQFATGSEAGHLDHPGKHFDVPGVVLSHCAKVAIELFCQSGVRLDILLVLVQCPADDKALEYVQEELAPVLRAERIVYLAFLLVESLTHHVVYRHPLVLLLRATTNVTIGRDATRV